MTHNAYPTTLLQEHQGFFLYSPSFIDYIPGCIGTSHRGRFGRMRAVIQRVKGSRVSVAGEEIGAIGPGILVFLGVATGDTEEDALQLASKVIGLRIFEDPPGKMNRSLLDIGGQVMVVSQFTLLGECRKGRRPSFVKAAPPEKALSLYETFVRTCESYGVPVVTGTFRARMEVHLVNDGPVTFVIDSEKPRGEERGETGCPRIRG